MRKQKSTVVGVQDQTKTLESSTSKPTFSKKRTILIVFFAILSIIIVGLTIKFVLDINWNRLFTSISSGFANRIGILLFILLFLYFIFNIVNNYFTVWVRLKKLGYKISSFEYWLLGFATAFLRSVTPTFMGDSFALVWMKANGVPTYRVTSLLFTNTFLWQVVQYLVTFPSFIAVLIFRSTILATPEGIAVFTLLCIGIVVDTFSVLFMYLLCVSKRVHYFLSRIFNWFKKKLHMRYHTKAEIEEKYKGRAVIKQEFYGYMKDVKTTLITFLWLVLAEIVVYLAIDLSLYFVQYVQLTRVGIYPVVTYQVHFNFIWAFNSANVTFTANRLNFFIPNGEGSLEYILRTYLTHYGDFTSTPAVPMDSELGKTLIKTATDNSILVWRFFGAFIPAVFGLFGCVWWIIRKSLSVKKGKKLFVEEK